MNESKDNRDMENWATYRADNLQAWNERTPVHISSAMYDVPGFLAGRTSLKAPELTLLGDVADKDLLHLQCHFGLDTLSFARMGAKVSGLDFSDVAIGEANRLAHECGLDAHFICADVYDLSDYVKPSSKDIVFVSYGALCWLPDLHHWAREAYKTLRTGGRLILVEFHPTLYLFDFPSGQPAYPYFQHSKPISEEVQGTYAHPNAALLNREHFWSHPLSEVFDALLGAGFELADFREWDYSPWNCFEHMREDAPGQYRYALSKYPLPHLYGLRAQKD
jgi:SAM-dependent methyltransferase